MDQKELHQTSKIFKNEDSFEKIKRLIDFEHGPKLKILDVGCGPGLLDNHLSALGHEVVGLDIQVPENFTGQFIQCDINQSWSVQREFDLVICTDVPEHMYDPAHILREAAKVLKPNGKLVFGVPNHFDIRQRFRTLFGKGIVHWDHLQYGQKSWMYAHIRFSNYSELRDLFSQEKWSIETIQLNFMGAGIIPRRLLPGFLRKALVRTWPNLFSGKFIFLLNPVASKTKPKLIVLGKTPKGL